jgi:hypothetical protein
VAPGLFNEAANQYKLTKPNQISSIMKKVKIIGYLSRATISILVMACCLVHVLSAQSYCSFTSNCNDGDRIENFSTTGGITNITNNNSGCSPGAYGNYTATHNLTVSPGMTVNLSVQAYVASSYEQGFAIWIDWNQNMVWEASELVWSSPTYGLQVFTGSFIVPLTAMSGTTRMRVMAGYYCVPSNPCLTCASYGEAEDYTVTVTGGVDAGLDGFMAIPDTLCAGPRPVAVKLKNHGPFNMTSVGVEWRVNNVMMPIYNWTGTLPANADTTVVIGNYTFTQGVTYDISAWTKNPNNVTDTVNHNDTIHLANKQVKTSPALVLNDTVLAICQGDTAFISGTLSGSPPWSFVVSDGTITLPVTGITNPIVVVPVIPTAGKTYTITGLSDGSGCDNLTQYKVTVSVQQAPPANVTAIGGLSAACQGDSVMLMASVGMNFGYKWFHEGVQVPGATNYVFAAKLGGNYTAEVTSPIGCSKMSAPFLVTIHPAPVVNLGNDTAILPHQVIMLNAGPGFNSYLWSTGASSASITVDSSGVGIGVKTVWVQVTDNYSCKGRDTILINFTPHPSVIKHQGDAAVAIYPNPSEGRFMLKLFGVHGNATLRILNVTGKLVYTETLTLQGELSKELHIGHLATGIYHLQIHTNNGTLTEKVVIR